LVDLLIYGAVILGVGAAAFLVARSPTFWLQMAVVAFKAALPFILKRKSLEEEAKDHDLAAHGRQVGNPRPWGHEKGVDS
jgi:membrane protein implicated in regulation of membrane protease activity